MKIKRDASGQPIFYESENPNDPFMAVEVSKIATEFVLYSDYLKRSKKKTRYKKRKK